MLLRIREYEGQIGISGFKYKCVVYVRYSWMVPANLVTLSSSFLQLNSKIKMKFTLTFLSLLGMSHGFVAPKAPVQSPALRAYADPDVSLAKLSEGDSDFLCSSRLIRLFNHTYPKYPLFIVLLRTSRGAISRW